MVDVDKAVIARYKKGGNTFEILVDCDEAIKLREGKEVDLSDVLADEKIFSDSGKGLLAAHAELVSTFDTDNVQEIAKKIIKDGELQLTAQYRAKLREQKMNRVITHISRNGVDPRTSLPHPRSRIELAFEEAKIKIDENKDEKRLIEEIVKKLKVVLPINFAKKEIAIRIPAEHASKAFGQVRQIAKVTKDEWATDGSWFAIVEIPAGMQNELFDKVNSMTHGEAELKILKVIE